MLMGIISDIHMGHGEGEIRTPDERPRYPLPESQRRPLAGVAAPVSGAPLAAATAAPRAALERRVAYLLPWRAPAVQGGDRPAA